jgi:hypothetical protein
MYNHWLYLHNTDLVSSPTKGKLKVPIECCAAASVDEPDQIYSSRVHQILITAILQKFPLIWLLDLIFFSEAQQQTQPDKLVAPPKSSSLGEDCQEFHQHSH